MAALDPKELLIRTAISAIAGVVTTTVLVETAERTPSRRRRKKRKKSGTKKAGAKKKKSAAQREAERRATTPARRASQEIGALPGPGMTVEAFVDSIKSAPSRMSTAIGNVFSRQEKQEHVDGTPGQRGRKKDGFETLKEEAFYVAKTAVKAKIVETTGMGGAISAVEKGADAVKKAGADVAKKIKESVPDDVGEKVAGAGRAISEGGKKLGRAVKEGLPEDEEDVEELKAKLDEKVSGFSRWIEGPGAPNYRRHDADETTATRAPKAAVSARDVDVSDAEPPRWSGAARASPIVTPASESPRRDSPMARIVADDIAPAGEGGHHLAVDEVMALREQLDALMSGEGAPIDDDVAEIASDDTAVSDGTSAVSSASAADALEASGVYAPKEGTPKLRPILRDDGKKRDASSGALKGNPRRER